MYSWLENAKIYRDYDTVDKPLPKKQVFRKETSMLGG